MTTPNEDSNASVRRFILAFDDISFMFLMIMFVTVILLPQFIIPIRVAIIALFMVFFLCLHLYCVTECKLVPMWWFNRRPSYVSFYRKPKTDTIAKNKDDKTSMFKPLSIGIPTLIWGTFVLLTLTSIYCYLAVILFLR